MGNTKSFIAVFIPILILRTALFEYIKDIADDMLQNITKIKETLWILETNNISKNSQAPESTV